MNFWGVEGLSRSFHLAHGQFNITASSIPYITLKAISRRERESASPFLGWFLTAVVCGFSCQWSFLSTAVGVPFLQKCPEGLVLVKNMVLEPFSEIANEKLRFCLEQPQSVAPQFLQQTLVLGIVL